MYHRRQKGGVLSMTYSDLPPRHRRSIRLPHFDYTSGAAYFVTLCTLNRACLFGEVIDGAMQLNEAGRVAEAEWVRTAEMRPHAALDEFVVMPNHLHGIVVLRKDLVAQWRDADGAARSAAGAPHTNEGVREGQGVRSTPLRDGESMVPGSAEVVSGSPAGVRSTPLRDGETNRGDGQRSLRAPRSGSLGSVLAGYKAAVTRALATLPSVAGASVWQRGYYEHVIRNDEDLDRIRRYITENPARWDLDRENPAFHP
jgi:REP-associated tyrosine transposase